MGSKHLNTQRIGNDYFCLRSQIGLALWILIISLITGPNYSKINDILLNDTVFRLINILCNVLTKL